MRSSFAVVVLVANASVAAAAPPDKPTCLAAHEKAQTARAAGKLREAHEKLLVCSADACPALVKLDCTKWVTEVEKDLPSVIVRAKDAQANDLADVRVEVDGVVVAKFLDGKPIVVDPGAHAFRYVREGSKPIEEQIVVRVGEKNRVLTVTFADDSKPEPAPQPVDEGPRVLPWVALGVGAVALGSFAYFGLTARSRLAELRDTCAPSCDSSERASIERRLIVADVSLVVSVASFGVATWLFLSAPEKPTAVALTPLPSGGLATFSARF